MPSTPTTPQTPNYSNVAVSSANYIAVSCSSTASHPTVSPKNATMRRMQKCLCQRSSPCARVWLPGCLAAWLPGSPCPNMGHKKTQSQGQSLPHALHLLTLLSRPMFAERFAEFRLPRLRLRLVGQFHCLSCEQGVARGKRWVAGGRLHSCACCNIH